MTNNQNQPNQYDAVLGGNSPPPIHGAVLGGIEGVKKRLASSDVDIQISALNDALNYGDVGLDLVIPELKSESINRRELAYRLLRDRKEPQVKSVLKKYKFWNRDEKLYGLPDQHSTTFANRKVIEFDQNIGITETVDTAYALRANYHWRSRRVDISIDDKLQILQEKLQKNLAEKIEALIFGDAPDIECIVLKTLKEFINVKAIFIGDIAVYEFMNSSIYLSHISPILQALPLLEVLKLRGKTNIYNQGENFISNPYL